MRTIKSFIPVLFLLFLVFSCKNVSDYVELGASGGNHTFSFPKETGGHSGASYSYISYNGLNQIISFNLSVTFNSSGNNYSIDVYSTKYFFLGDIKSYSTSITATINGIKISGKLNYP